MSEFRNWLMLALSVSLAMFAVENRFLTLPLVFLNWQSVALPLSVWMLLSLAAGVLTSFLIFGMFKISNYAMEKQLSVLRRRSAAQTPPQPTPVQPDTTLQGNWGATASTGVAYEVRDRVNPTFGSASAVDRDDYEELPRPQAVGETRYDDEEPERPRTSAVERDDYEEPTRPKAAAQIRDDYDELADDDSLYEDWEEEEELADSEAVKKDSTTYEVTQEPKTISRSGTIYSIGYREPSDTGVGKTESVQDADYRVINPPVREPETQDDDWGKKVKKNEDW